MILSPHFPATHNILKIEVQRHHVKKLRSIKSENSNSTHQVLTMNTLQEMKIFVDFFLSVNF
jgi:hypothetical protein